VIKLIYVSQHPPKTDVYNANENDEQAVTIINANSVQG